MTRFVLFLAVALFAADAGAATYRDVLLPEGSAIGGSEFTPDYQIIVQGVLHEAYDRDVKLRFVQEPSFQPESAVFLTENTGKFRIVTLEPVLQLWAYESLEMMKHGQILKTEGTDPKTAIRPTKEISELESELPADYHQVKVKRCEVDVDSAMAQRIIAVWKSMLLETRYTQPGEDSVVVSDGVAYHFSMFSDMEFLAGWTNYAPAGGRLAALVDIPGAMWGYCAKPDNDSFAKLDERVSRLETLLQNEKQMKQSETK